MKYERLNQATARLPEKALSNAALLEKIKERTVSKSKGRTGSPMRPSGEVALSVRMLFSSPAEITSSGADVLAESVHGTAGTQAGGDENKGEDCKEVFHRALQMAKTAAPVHRRMLHGGLATCAFSDISGLQIEGGGRGIASRSKNGASSSDRMESGSGIGLP
jgi:hypothetical protein